ncbi:prepilin peptidase [Brevibacillus thermoruber]
MLMVLSLFVQDGIGGGDMKLLTFLGFALGFPLR